MCKDIYRSVLWDVGKITSVPAAESYPGWGLFLGWGSGKIRGQVALGIRPAFSRCSYNGKNLIWEVCLDMGNGVFANGRVQRERNQRAKRSFGEQPEEQTLCST